MSSMSGDLWYVSTTLAVAPCSLLFKVLRPRKFLALKLVTVFLFVAFERFVTAAFNDVKALVTFKLLYER